MTRKHADDRPVDEQQPPVEACSESDESGERDAQPIFRRAGRAHKHSRVTTAVPAGSDPHPAPEPSRNRGTDNDARLKADKPPHY